VRHPTQVGVALTVCTIDIAEDFEYIIPRFSVRILTHEFFKEATTGMYALTEATVKHYPQHLIVSGWAERIIAGVLRREALPVSRWDILGWRNHVADGVRHTVIFIKMWP
jgi:hypothetical protein